MWRAARCRRCLLLTGSTRPTPLTWCWPDSPSSRAHPDVSPGLHRIHAAGIRLVTLTNGATAISDRMLDGAGVLPLLEHRLSVEVPKRWKPHPDAYRYAAEVCGVELAAMALVAVHPWDVDGAHRAGLTGVWVDLRKTPYPPAFLPPDLQVPDLETLADMLTA
jgi:2-haloacid dehalogenase